MIYTNTKQALQNVMWINPIHNSFFSFLSLDILGKSREELEVLVIILDMNANISIYANNYDNIF